jgi:hypothetical protein
MALEATANQLERARLMVGTRPNGRLSRHGPTRWTALGLPSDGELGYPIGVNLADAIWVLLVIPALGLPFGVIGAAIGHRSRAAPPFRAGMEPLPAPTGPNTPGRVSFH